ncbi:MAG: HipA family kinase [Planctomycetaceae bacterium]|nr:HipA family kinase [Planctomycetaceae bacterium]
MPTAAEWTILIAAKEAAAPAAVTAHTYLRTRFSSISKPALMACSDGQEYVVKSIANPCLKRAMANDQVMGRAAAAMNAPVPTVALVNVPQDLINGQPELADFVAGVTHGSKYMPDASKTRQGIAHGTVPDNRGRFASLALLYGLALVQRDHQFFYQDGAHLVWSFDHGHFFPNGPNWSVASLQGVPPATPDAQIVAGCALSLLELAGAKPRLNRVTDDVLAEAIGAVPAAWDVTPDEKAELAVYLERRRDELSA